jgi:hypothetical protein
MPTHPNVDRLSAAYGAFGRGDLVTLGNSLADDVRWHIAGRSVLAGDYVGRDAVFALFGRLFSLTAGSLRLDVQALLADDSHGFALVHEHAARDGREFDAELVQVMQLEDGLISAFAEYPTDQYSYDAFFHA